MDFWTAVLSCLKQYAGFTGRASRSEYWYFQLFVVASALALGAMEYGIDFYQKRPIPDYPFLVSLLELILLLPLLSVTVRRFHDTNHKGFWAFVLIILNSAFIYLWEETGQSLFLLGVGFNIGLTLLWCCRRGTKGRNLYGEDPLKPPKKTAADICKRV